MTTASLLSADRRVAFSLSLEDDADRLVDAMHIDDLVLSGPATVLRVYEQDGTPWIRTLVGGDDRAFWVAA